MTIAAINGKGLFSVNFDLKGSLRAASSFLLSKVGDLYSYCVSSCFSRSVETIDLVIQKRMKAAEREIASRPSLTEPEKEMIIDSWVTEISKTILAKQKNHIIIKINMSGGFGDLLFGLRLADILLKNLPSVEIALVFYDYELQNSQHIIKEYPHLKNHCYRAQTYPEELPEAFKDPKSGICIGVATYGSTSDLGYNLRLPDEYPLLALPEYALFSEKKYTQETSVETMRDVKVAGLTRYEYGIFIDSKLKAAVQKKWSDFIFHSDPILHVDELSEGLRKEIIGEQSPAKYSSRTNFYFGYGHFPPTQKHFIRSVAHLEKNKSSKNVDLLLILDEPDRLEQIFDDSLKEELALQGFGQIEITGSPSREPKIIKLKDSGRILRIMPKKELSHRDFEGCLLMSQPLSLITGDQSLSEGISAGKIFIYELFFHKFHLAESFKSLAAELKLPLVEEYFVKTTVDLISLLKDERKSSEYDELATKFFLNKDFIEQWNIFIKYIQEKKSFNEKVVSLVGRRLASLYYPSLSPPIAAKKLEGKYDN
jgi:hypothetical protein